LPQPARRIFCPAAEKYSDSKSNVCSRSLSHRKICRMLEGKPRLIGVGLLKAIEGSISSSALPNELRPQ